ncbi:MAG: exonuclease domain-containing protein [Bacteroidota bacterium]
MYAIVDIETTGGYAGKSRITEIAIFIHDGEKVVDTYQSLINPEQVVPAFITGLTGISQDMVDSAPTFSEVADEIYEILSNNVFVAHNVSFDYSFVKNEFERAGHLFNNKKLCTVRLSRKIIPGKRSYSLGNLCEQLGIHITDRHRAAGDAKATVKLFELLLENGEDKIKEALNQRSKETNLPPNLPKEEFLSLPEEPGVYYFLDARSEVIYVGKAINIKKRITGHFSGTPKDRRNQYIRNEIHHIGYELTGNELIALIFESQEIKRIWPKYNQSQKMVAKQFSIYRYEDRAGYWRFNVGKKVNGMQPLINFNSHADAWHFLIDKVKEHELCSKLAGIHQSTGACYDLEHGHCKGACVEQEAPDDYNERVDEAIATFIEKEKSIAILGAGRNEEESSVILVEEGVYQGFGFFDYNVRLQTIDDVKMVINQYKTTNEIDTYIQSYLNSGGAQVIEL